MAKAFKDYTIDDLYRLNFSFLITGIKEKELEDSSLSEEVFIRTQKIALMTIFSELDSRGVDSTTTTIEPFLNGKRLKTDLAEISAICEGLSKIEVPVKEELAFPIPNGLSSLYRRALTFKVGLRDYSSEIGNLRNNITGRRNAIESLNQDILSYSRHIAEWTNRIEELNVLMANDAINPHKTNYMAKILAELAKNDYRVYYISVPASLGSDSAIYIYTFRIAKIKVENPNDRTKTIYMPLPTFIKWEVRTNRLAPYGHGDNYRRFIGTRVCEYFHPHIASNGSSGLFCLGNTATILSKMEQQGFHNHIADTIKVYTDLTDTYNPSSPYRIIQELYLNASNFLLEIRRFFTIDNVHDLQTCDTALLEPAIKACCSRLIDNFSDGISKEVVAEFFVEYLIAIRESVTPELISFIENSSGMNTLSVNTNYFTDNYLGSATTNNELLIRVLKRFINQGDTNEEEQEEIDF